MAGSQIVANLVQKDAEILALARSPEKAKFPRGVTAVKGDLMDVDATETAIAEKSTLFLLNAVTPDELAQALFTLSCARLVPDGAPIDPGDDRGWSRRHIVIGATASLRGMAGCRVCLREGGAQRSLTQSLARHPG